MPKHYRPPGKKKEGNAAKYITRSQAIRYLQISISDFRVLCIFKGISPREPKKKVKGNHHTYYHVKDIMFIKHSPNFPILRVRHALEKKMKKAQSKKDRNQLERIQGSMPPLLLDLEIRERYPRFVDALGDLDDCLSMVHLFAALPTVERQNIEVKHIHHCRRLSHEWQAYISRTHKLRKAFVSVKGIYYEAEVEGQKITWLTPHALQQVLPEDVDYKIMVTYVELYETLLSFVNFKLYHSINVKYPPLLDPRLEALAADLYALSRYFDANSKALSLDPHNVEETELRLAQFQYQLSSDKPGALMNQVKDAEGIDEDDADTRKCKNLFRGRRFFLSREVPRESLLFVIPAFGGVVSWEGEGAPFKESDQTITHQIVDRPIQGHKFLSREYVQPQWVYDCINHGFLLPTEEYMVGRVPPPHLSPFVDNEAEGYVPEYADTIKRLLAVAEKEVLPMPGMGTEELSDPQSLLVEGIIDRAEAIEAAEKKKKLSVRQTQYLNELKSELQGSNYTPVSKDGMQNIPQGKSGEEESVPDLHQTAEDAENLSKALMPRKKRRLYDAIKIGQENKRAGTDILKERRKKIKAAKGSE